MNTFPAGERDRPQAAAFDTQADQADVDGLLRQIRELRFEIDEHKDTIQQLTALIGEKSVLLAEFADRISRLPYISLDSTARKAIAPFFERAMGELVGSNTTVGEAVEADNVLNPDVQRRISEGTREITEAYRSKAQAQAVELRLIEARADAELYFPQMLEMARDAYMKSPEGIEQYKLEYDKALAELASENPSDVARRVQHKAYLDAESDHLDLKANELRVADTLARARDSFETLGLDVAGLPKDTEITIWLGSPDCFRVLMDKERLPGNDDDNIAAGGVFRRLFGNKSDHDEELPPYMPWSRKIMGVTTSDSFYGIHVIRDDRVELIYDDIIIPAPRWTRLLPGRLSAKTVYPSDRAMNARSSYQIGHVRHGYEGNGPELHPHIIGGQSLAFDDNPEDTRIYQTNGDVVVNVAINGVPVLPYREPSSGVARPSRPYSL